ncbi:unnamed protein product [Blepharisma stoltei]|uniref:NAC domain-containing protein n=1 Tax=Blepharisma stoltei TaxID=1481888 RepID=A0AAU9IEX1_9CILI|nr:unnamed protein product [Blepharisma stoltei]
MEKHNNSEAIEFDWESKWLKGEEYSYILTHKDTYCEKYGMKKYASKTHPQSIYIQPKNGQIYFVKGSSIGSEFGFPRVDIKKRYRWKKMNFTTELPKRQPIVTYIVASAVKCEKSSPNEQKIGPSYRMHAVVLSQPEEDPYILCHVRKLSQDENTPIETESPIVKKLKREPLAPIENGLHDLLNASNLLMSPIKSTPLYVGNINSKQLNFSDLEHDYVSMFKNNSINKFPALSTHFKAPFFITQA